MPTNELKLVQVSPRVQAPGGIETLHAHHERLPVAQQFVALFDRDPRARTEYVNLNFGWRTPLRRMREAFRRALEPHRGAVVIYSNGWGLPLFHDLDGAARRVVYCYAHPEYHYADLPSWRGLVDGAIGITPAMHDAWLKTLPELGEDRRAILSMPIEVPAGLERQAEASGEIVLGYAGRVESLHKRLDRLPGFLRAMRARGVKFRFEVLGDGSFRSVLQREVGDLVRFHGWTTKEEFWRVISRWDAAVYFTDVDGGPIALIEAMALGVLPFFPAIGGSLGDDYTPRVDPRGHYSRGDMKELAGAVEAVFAQSSAEIAAARARARAVVARHTESNYCDEMMRFMARVTERSRIAATRKRRPRIADVLPLGLITRIAPWALRAN